MGWVRPYADVVGYAVGGVGLRSGTVLDGANAVGLARLVVGAPALRVARDTRDVAWAAHRVGSSLHSVGTPLHNVGTQ